MVNNLTKCIRQPRRNETESFLKKSRMRLFIAFLCLQLVSCVSVPTNQIGREKGNARLYWASPSDYKVASDPAGSDLHVGRFIVEMERKEAITLAPGFCSIEAEVWGNFGVKTMTKLDFDALSGSDYVLFALDVPKGVNPETIKIRQVRWDDVGDHASGDISSIVLFPIALVIAGIISIDPPKDERDRYVWIQEKSTGTKVAGMSPWDPN
jgi:hypothetical protein